MDKKTQKTLDEYMAEYNKKVANMTLKEARGVVARSCGHSDMRIEFEKAVKMLLDCADKALEQEQKKGRMIDADELLKRISEKAKTPSLSEATVNGLCGATAIIYDMLNESEVDNADSN